MTGRRVLVTGSRSVLDDDLAGVRSALLARRVAFGQMREYAERARAAGRSWDEVGAALELPDHDRDGDKYGRSRGEVAFEWLIEGRDPDADHGRGWLSRATAGWTCSTCNGRVTDQGPYEPHPDDNEDGHTPDCARQGTAVRAYERARGDF